MESSTFQGSLESAFAGLLTAPLVALAVVCIVGILASLAGRK